MSGPFVSLAKKLINQGYHVVPIPLGSKGPVLHDWRNTFPRTAEAVEALSRRHSTDGVGIITKFTPAVDVDVLDPAVADHMEQFIRDNLDDAPLRIGKWPKRLMLFSCDEPFAKVTSARFIDPKNPGVENRVEVLADGQQFVAYHTHPDTGKPYEWPNDWDNPLDVCALDLPVIGVAHARAVVQEFERHCKALGWEQVGRGSDGSSADTSDALAQQQPPTESEDEVARCKSALATISPDCSRDEYLAVLAGLKWTGWLCAEELAQEWAEGSKEGKYDESDFNRDWKSLKQERSGRTTTLGSVFKMAKDAGWDASRPKVVDAEKVKVDRDYFVAKANCLEVDDSAGAMALLKELRESGIDSLTHDVIFKAICRATKLSRSAINKSYRETRSADNGLTTHNTYARRMAEEIEDESGTKPVGTEGRVFKFVPAERVWEGQEPTELTVDVAIKFDGLENCARRSDYLAIANQLLDNTSKGKREFFEDAPIGMACGLRFYRVNEEGEIVREELTAAHRQRVRFPVAPAVGPTPLFDKFLDETFRDNNGVGQRTLLQEIIGATMLGFFYKYEKAVLMYGPGRSGKGTIMKIIEALIPRAGITAVSPAKWDNEYYVASLAGARLNCVGELEEDGVIEAAALKSVTGRDILTGRHPAGRPFTFTNKATQLFNGNYFPPTRDHSEAFYSRWVLMWFKNSRLESGEALDEDLASKIIATELPHIAAWAMQGAKRLLERGRLELPPEHTILMDMWRRRSNSVVEFVMDRDECRVGTSHNHVTRRAAFYDAYAAYCKVSGRKAVGKTKLYEQLASGQFKKIGVTMVTRDGYDCVRGVMVRSNAFFGVEDDGDDL